jgi:hypothetical protein
VPIVNYDLREARMYRPDTPAHLAGKAAHRLPCLSRRVIAEIRRQMKVYNVESAVVSDEDLAQSVTSNLRTLIDALCMPDEVDLSQARATGESDGLCVAAHSCVRTRDCLDRNA